MGLEREKDIERLRTIALLLESQMQRLLAVLAKQSAELDALKGGGQSLQLALKLLEDAKRTTEKELGDALAKRNESAPADDAGNDDDKAPRPPRPGHGPTEQPELEHVNVRCELDEADRACTSCGGRMQAMAGQVERSEMIDVVDIKYQVVVVEQQKYVCRCGGAVETAPGPERAVAGGRYSLRFALKVAFDKYVAHLPLERQVRLMAHHGLRVTSQTLWDQVWAVVPLLEPTYHAIFKRLRASPVIGVDQTGWPDLEDKTLPPWQMWCVTAPGLVYHQICDDKSARTFQTLLGDYKGWVVADALGTHEAGARECRGVKLAACWAHVLRRFREAVLDFPEAQCMLAWIGDLYRIDERAKDLDERRRLRATESKAVTEKMKAWMLETRALRSTSLGTSVRYTLNIWSRLIAFIDDPQIWLDNNATERAIRGPVVGRRNHFGSKSARGTHAAAVIYTLVESAKVNGMDPISYLMEVATKARQNAGNVLLPADFASPSQAA